MSQTKAELIDAKEDFTISGTTPTLTIGDAGAEDTMLVFDGNAIDFRIGLDEEKLLNELGNINETLEDFIEVSENNIDSLLENEEEEDNYCNVDNFKFSIE